MEIIFDFGNARGKWYAPRKNEYGDFLHAIAFLSEGEWRGIVGRGKAPNGIIKVNGQAVAVGDAARRYTIAERPKGAARYKQTYYGIGLAYTLTEAIKRDDANVSLFASHAPIDIQYARNLIASAQGRWDVESRYGHTCFEVRHVETFDEPLGGFSHYTFTEKGEERKRNPLRDKTTLVVDVGGHTVDVAAIDPGGEIDSLSLNSTRTGVIQLMKDFESELRTNNATLFQDTGDLDINRVEKALIAGVYQFGKVAIECQFEANGAIQSLVNDVIQVITAAGGAANFDVILLTGGGAALIYDHLTAAFPRIDFVLAEEDRKLMKYANVFGGAKLAALLRRTE